MKTKILLIWIIVLIFIPLSSIEGLTMGQARQDNRLLLSISPPHPTPGQIVTVELRSYAFNLLNSHIEWTSNGQKIASGTGLTSVKVEAQELGAENEIVVIIKTADDLILGNTINFRPGDVDILWSAQTYTPLFYQGSPLPSPGSEIIVEAQPYLYNKNRAKIANSDIYFNWSLNGQKDNRQSGMGNRFFNFKKRDSQDVLTLNIRDRSGEIKAEREITIENIGPQPQIYLIKPLMGIINDRTLEKEFSYTEEELILLTEPFNLDRVMVEKKEIIYQWKLDDDIIREGDDRKISFLRPLEESFDFTINLAGTNPQNIKQSFSINLPIIFKGIYESF